MNSTVKTVSFSGLFANDVLVQVHISTGLPSITIVGLASKSVAESKERVRAALSNMGLALPPKRISVNLSPAGMIKEGAHFDLPIALAIMIAMGALPQEYLDETIILGELSLDGSILSVSGVLLAAMSASEKDMCLICPESNGAEAVWANELKIIAAPTLHALCNHLRGILPLNYPVAKLSEPEKQKSDMADKIIEAFNNNCQNKKISILGLSFKPETDDMRDSPSLDIIPILKEKGFDISVFDPVAMDEAKKILKNIEFSNNIEECLQDSDGLVILTEWNEFRGLSATRLKKVMKGNILVDLRNSLNPESFQKSGFNLIQLGRPKKTNL